MKIFTGVVVSTKMAKTAKVAVSRVVAHPVYGKRIRRVKNYLVHDETGVQVGQKVQFVACKPYSARKRWRIFLGDDKVVENSKTAKKPLTKASAKKGKKK